MISGDDRKYVDLDIYMSVRGRVVAQGGSALEPTVNTDVVNNLLHSLFS